MSPAAVIVHVEPSTPDDAGVVVGRPSDPSFGPLTIRTFRSGISLNPDNSSADSSYSPDFSRLCIHPLTPSALSMRTAFSAGDGTVSFLCSSSATATEAANVRFSYERTKNGSSSTLCVRPFRWAGFSWTTPKLTVGQWSRRERTPCLDAGQATAADEEVFGRV